MTLTVVAGVDPSVPAPQDDRSIRAHSFACEINSILNLHRSRNSAAFCNAPACGPLPFTQPAHATKLLAAEETIRAPS